METCIFHVCVKNFLPRPRALSSLAQLGFDGYVVQHCTTCVVVALTNIPNFLVCLLVSGIATQLSSYSGAASDLSNLCPGTACTVSPVYY